MDPRCDEIRELAPELALGIVEGEERGRALEHLADCPDCRRRVDELAEVADQLLLLAPHREPPVGFESSVLNEVLPAPPKRRRRRRFAFVLAPAATAVAAAAITLAVVSGDIETASHYRQTLQQANGKEFEAYSLYGPGGRFAGTVFSYQGAPNWLLITVDASHRADLSGAQLVMDDGSQRSLSWFHLDASGSSGGGIPVDPHRVSVLRLLPGAGGQPLVAHFTS
jgi:anti-sigma factor RsiW